MPKKSVPKKPVSKKPTSKKSVETPDSDLPAQEVSASELSTSEKLQKVLAAAGYASRREIERWITSGRIQINGKTAKLGDRVTSEDTIDVDGRRFHSEQTEKVIRVLLYNKPEGEICTRSDPEGRPTVFDHLPRIKGERWVAIGRLDINTSGLLLFTNDGSLANKLMHPSSNIDREYMVRVFGTVDDDMLQRMKDGVLLEDGSAKFTDISVGQEKGANRWYTVALMEGRNREVRRLWESQGVEVNRLKRVRFGPIFLPSYTSSGQWLELEHQAIADLCWQAGIDEPKKRTLLPAEKRLRERRVNRLRSKGRKK